MEDGFLRGVKEKPFRKDILDYIFIYINLLTASMFLVCSDRLKTFWKDLTVVIRLF